MLPILRLLSRLSVWAGRIERGDWYELRQDILRMQSALAGHPLKGLMGARVDIIEHQLYIAHEVGKRIAPRVCCLLTKLVWAKPSKRV